MTAHQNPRPPRLLEPDRSALGKRLRARYDAGATVRQVAEHFGRGYYLTHTLLREAGTAMRPRGGNHRARA